MDVHDPAAEALDQAGGEDLHEPREHDQVHLPLVEPVGQRDVARGAVRIVLRREDARLDPRVARPPERLRVRLVRRHGHDLDAVAAVDLVEQRLKVRPGPRREDRHPEASRRDREHRVRPARRREPAVLDQLVDPLEDLRAPHVRRGAVRGQPVIGVLRDLLRARAVHDRRACGPAHARAGGLRDRQDRLVERCRPTPGRAPAARARARPRRRRSTARSAAAASGRRSGAGSRSRRQPSLSTYAQMSRYWRQRALARLAHRRAAQRGRAAVELARRSAREPLRRRRQRLHDARARELPEHGPQLLVAEAGASSSRQASNS